MLNVALLAEGTIDKLDIEGIELNVAPALAADPITRVLPAASEPAPLRTSVPLLTIVPPE